MIRSVYVCGKGGGGGEKKSQNKDIKSIRGLIDCITCQHHKRFFHGLFPVFQFDIATVSLLPRIDPQKFSVLRTGHRRNT